MKRYLLLFLFLAACARAPIPKHADDSNTAHQIPTGNAAMLPNLQTFLGTESASRALEDGLVNFVDNASSGFAQANFPCVQHDSYTDDSGAGDAFPDMCSCWGSCATSSGTTCTITNACFQAYRPVTCTDQTTAANFAQGVPSAGSVAVTVSASATADKAVCVQN